MWISETRGPRNVQVQLTVLTRDFWLSILKCIDIIKWISQQDAEILDEIVVSINWNYPSDFMWFISRRSIQLVQLSLNLILPTSAHYLHCLKIASKDFSPQNPPFNKTCVQLFLCSHIFLKSFFMRTHKNNCRTNQLVLNECLSKNFDSQKSRMLWALQQRHKTANKTVQNLSGLFLITIQIFGNIILICVVSHWERHKGEGRKNT